MKIAEKLQRAVAKPDVRNWLVDTFLCLILFAIVTALGDYSERWLAAHGMEPENTVIDNAVTAAIAAGFAYALLRERRRSEALLQQKQQMLVQRQQTLLETFDHIRNALQIIMYNCRDERTAAAVGRLTEAMGRQLKENPEEERGASRDTD